MTVEELGELVRGVRMLARALASPVGQGRVGDRLNATRALFTRRVVARCDLAAGAVLDERTWPSRSPTAMPTQELAELVGRRLEAAVGG